VVWCDPRWFTLGLKPAFGVRRQELIGRDVPRDVVDKGRRAYDTWRTAREGARRSGGAPSLTVEAAGAWAAHDRPAPPVDVRPGDVTMLTVGPGPGESAVPRPGGVMFGLLVHAVLAQAPFDASVAALNDLAGVEGRALGATGDEVAAAARTAARLLSHELLVRARAAAARGACRRETPVTLSLADGSLVEGVVDLAFEENGAWTIVDYKTDRELAAAGEDRYRRQIALYASAVAQATGQPAVGVLFRVW
jgi:ATP-dependent exoDNAse (exonuclease V) beta subunit